MCFGFLGVTANRPGAIGFRFSAGGPVLYRPGSLPSVKRSAKR
jgi:hypothetical protein